MYAYKSSRVIMSGNHYNYYGRMEIIFFDFFQSQLDTFSRHNERPACFCRIVEKAKKQKSPTNLPVCIYTLWYFCNTVSVVIVGIWRDTTDPRTVRKTTRGAFRQLCAVFVLNCRIETHTRCGAGESNIVHRNKDFLNKITPFAEKGKNDDLLWTASC